MLTLKVSMCTQACLSLKLLRFKSGFVFGSTWVSTVILFRVMILHNSAVRALRKLSESNRRNVVLDRDLFLTLFLFESCLCSSSSTGVLLIVAD